MAEWRATSIWQLRILARSVERPALYPRKGTLHATLFFDIASANPAVTTDPMFHVYLTSASESYPPVHYEERVVETKWVDEVKVAARLALVLAFNLVEGKSYKELWLVLNPVTVAGSTKPLLKAIFDITFFGKVKALITDEDVTADWDILGLEWPVEDCPVTPKHEGSGSVTQSAREPCRIS
jgi:hypothetical protein